MKKDKPPLIIAKCELDNGKIEEYHQCLNLGHTEWARYYKNMRYLGKGVTYTMNNRKVSEVRELHFWQNR